MRAESPLLLDTHIWLWLACGVQGKISASTLRAIEQAGQRRDLFISIISVWEIALLESKRTHRPADADADAKMGGTRTR